MMSRARLVGIVGAIIILWTGVGLALSGGVVVDGEVVIESADGPEVDVYGYYGEDFALDGPDGSNTVTVETDDGSITLSSDSPTTARLNIGPNPVFGEVTEVTNIQRDAPITIDAHNKFPVTVDPDTGGELTEIEYKAITLNDGEYDVKLLSTAGAQVKMDLGNANEIPTDTKKVAAVKSDVSATPGQIVDTANVTTTFDSGEFTLDLPAETSPSQATYDIIYPSPPDVNSSSASPTSGTFAQDVPVELSVDVSDPDFAAYQNEEVTVEFRQADGTVIGTDTLSANGTATTDFENVTGGTNEWYAVVTDAYGIRVDTRDLNDGAYEFNTPGVLEIRNEAQPSQLIDDNVSLRVRLFGANNSLVERQATNGTVSLAGVPVNKPLVVTVREANADFTYRRILLDSAIENSEVYLLPTDRPSAEVRFQLRDDTGRFDGEDTKLFVQKPVTRDYDGDGENETQYQMISGDRVGADGEFPTILVDSERYRLRVENDAGEQRVLGSYTVQGSRVTPLPIGRVEFSADVEQGAALQTSLREATGDAGHNYEVRLVYADPENATDELDITITDSDGNTIRPSTTESIDGAPAYVETYPIENATFDPEQDTATVSVTARGDFGEETYEQLVGDVPDVPIGPLNPQLAELIGLASIVAVAGLLIIKSPPLAAFISPGYAGLLTLVGIVDITMAGVVLAGLVGILAVVGTSRVT